MMLRILLLSSFLYTISCTSSQSEEKESGDQANDTPISSTYQVVITQNNSGFGYQILKDGKLIIDQPTIPAIQGNQSFSSREKAQKTADYLIEKLNKGHFPPTLSVEELDSLSVI